jgi:hypothetical protein
MEDLLARSRLNLGDFFYGYRSNNTAALVFYNETITIAPESEAAEEARARIADIEAGDSTHHWSRHSSQAPTSRLTSSLNSDSLKMKMLLHAHRASILAILVIFHGRSHQRL